MERASKVCAQALEAGQQLTSGVAKPLYKTGCSQLQIPDKVHTGVGPSPPEEDWQRRHISEPDVTGREEAGCQGRGSRKAEWQSQDRPLLSFHPQVYKLCLDSMFGFRLTSSFKCCRRFADRLCAKVQNDDPAHFTLHCAAT